MLFDSWMKGFLLMEADDVSAVAGGGVSMGAPAGSVEGAEVQQVADAAGGDVSGVEGAGDGIPDGDGLSGGGDFPGSVDEYAADFVSKLGLSDEDRAVVERFRAGAFEAKVAPEAFERLAGDLVRLSAENEAAWAEEQVAASNACLKDLKVEYGAKFDAVAELVNNTVTNLAHAAGVQPAAFNHVAIRNNPEIFRFFAHLGNMMKGSSFASQSNSPAEVSASQELHDIYYGSGDANRAFFDSNDPGHKRVNERVNYLLSIGGRIE